MQKAYQRVAKKLPRAQNLRSHKLKRMAKEGLTVYLNEWSISYAREATPVSSLKSKVIARIENEGKFEGLYALTKVKVETTRAGVTRNHNIECVNIFALVSGSLERKMTDCVFGEYYLKGLPLY